MKFFCSLFVLLAVLFVPAFAAPIESALSKRELIISVGITLGPIVIRDVEASVDEHLEHASKRATVTINGILGALTSTVSIKRSTEEYKVILTELPPSNGLSGRSTDSYVGRHMAVTLSDTLVEAFKQNDVTEEQFPQYISNNVHAKDPQTGNEYEFIPDYDSSVAPDIALFIDYVPHA